MGKSIRLKDDTYWDASSVVINNSGKTLQQAINDGSLGGGIGGSSDIFDFAYRDTEPSTTHSYYIGNKGFWTALCFIGINNVGMGILELYNTNSTLTITRLFGNSYLPYVNNSITYTFDREAGELTIRTSNADYSFTCIIVGQILHT